MFPKEMNVARFNPGPPNRRLAQGQPFTALVLDGVGPPPGVFMQRRI